MEKNNTQMLLFSDMNPQEAGIVAEVTDKGLLVDIEAYYNLIAKAGGYDSLTKEDTADFLGKLKEAGREDEIKRYFIQALKQPYLCRTSAEKETFTEEEYTRYYYTAIAIREINNTYHYFLSAYLSEERANTYGLAKASAYGNALAFAIHAEELRDTVGEEAYKGLIPSLDRVAERTNENGYLEYTRRRGVYKVNVEKFLNDIRPVAKVGKETIEAIKTAITSVEDTAEALEIKAYIMKDVEKLITKAKGSAENSYAIYTGIYNDILRSLKRKEVREAFTQHLEANIVRRDLAALTTYEEARVDAASYTHNLILYGGNTYFIAKEIEKNKA